MLFGPLLVLSPLQTAMSAAFELPLAAAFLWPVQKQALVPATSTVVATVLVALRSSSLQTAAARPFASLAGLDWLWWTSRWSTHYRGVSVPFQFVLFSPPVSHPLAEARL